MSPWRQADDVLPSWEDADDFRTRRLTTDLGAFPNRSEISAASTEPYKRHDGEDIPDLGEWETVEERNAAILEARRAGHSYRAIAPAAGVSHELVRKICLGLSRGELPAAERPPDLGEWETNEERDAAVVAARRRGHSFDAIAEAAGITRTTVRKIVHRAEERGA